MKKCFSWSTILKEIQNLQNLEGNNHYGSDSSWEKNDEVQGKNKLSWQLCLKFLLLLDPLNWLISANLGLNFNPGLFFFCSKAISQILFSLFYLEHPLNKLYTKRIKLNLLFKFSYQNSNFRPTLGFLYPALNNLALEQDDVYKNKLKFARLGL